jgi:hypothetical protein
MESNAWSMGRIGKNNSTQKIFNTGDTEEHWVILLYPVFLCVPCG